MKSSLISALAAQVATAVAFGPGGARGGPGGFGGYFGGPTCASSCFSSYWATATPTPDAYCGGSATSIGACVSSACTTDAAALSTFTSISASLCSLWSSCSSSGTYTYTYTKPTDVPDGWWGGSAGPWGTKTWPTGAVTVTGCPWNGGDVGWGAWGPGGGPGGPWGNFGPGWKYTTYTTGYTATGTGTAPGRLTTIGIATVAQAESGASTTRTTLGTAAAQETANAAPTDGLAGVKVMGAALGAVVVAAGLM